MMAAPGRKVLLACAGLMVAIGAAAALHRLVRRSSETATSLGTLLPDDGGAIAQVACVVNSARRSPVRNAALVAAVVNALPPRVRVTVLTNDRAAFVVAHDPSPGRVEFLDLPEDLNFTIWPQDPFLVLAGCQPPTLLTSAEFPRLDDLVIAQRLADHLGWDCRASDLVLEGGNIVAGSRHVFIGANTIHSNAARLEADAMEVARRFQKELGRPVVVVGPAPQPIGHIDMILTAIDGGRLALADPRRGARLAREELSRRPEAVAAFEAECERLYFGDPSIKELRGPNDAVLRPPKVAGQTGTAVDRSEAIADDLDKLAEQLATFGYHVERVPFLFGGELEPKKPAGARSADEGKPSDGNAETPPPAFPFLTYNNVLTEVLPAERIVYLPQYGWEALDRAGREAWRGLGYRVIRVPGFATSALHGGSLRCCVKVLRRSEGP